VTLVAIPEKSSASQAPFLYEVIELFLPVLPLLDEGLVAPVAEEY
jgi:hypothetical protein